MAAAVRCLRSRGKYINICIVLFQQLPCLSNGVVPSLMGNVCECMYVVDSPKRQGKAMNTKDIKAVFH